MKNHRSGQLSVTILFFAALTVVLVSGFSFLASSFLRFSVRSLNKAQAFAIAEAGIEYYRWHLAHAPQDYQDGTGRSGPYVHMYYNKSGISIGQFSLSIVPPPVGSSVVTITSAGRVFADTSVSKIIQVKMAIPSFAKYAVVVNSNIRFGSGTEVFGPIHSNGGIRFDALAHNLVTSALQSYNDPDPPYDFAFGVHTHVSPADPSPPATMPSRPDVFMAGRSIGIPAVDFTGITQNLAAIKANALSGGYYAPSSGALGYDLLISTSGLMTFYRVTALSAPPGDCSNVSGQSGWGTWSIQSETFYATSTIPANGNVFVEDNLWVNGQINNARVTIASGVFPDNPSTRTSITVNNNLRYTNYNGSDTIALIAQNNVNAALFSADTLRIDAALVAQNGRVGRYYYSSPECDPNSIRSSLTLYGMIATNQRYGFAYTDGTGYQTRNIIYDSNLLYSPPPSFPLTSSQYTPISWNEIQ